MTNQECIAVFKSYERSSTPILARALSHAILALGQEIDIDTLEQESRQIRLRMDRLEKERDELLSALEHIRWAALDFNVGRNDIMDAAMSAIASVKVAS